MDEDYLEEFANKILNEPLEINENEIKDKPKKRKYTITDKAREAFQLNRQKGYELRRANKKNKDLIIQEKLKEAKKQQEEAIKKSLVTAVKKMYKKSLSIDKTVNQFVDDIPVDDKIYNKLKAILEQIEEGHEEKTAPQQQEPHSKKYTFA